jgi:hypothetical protein
MESPLSHNILAMEEVVAHGMADEALIDDASYVLSASN